MSFNTSKYKMQDSKKVTISDGSSISYRLEGSVNNPVIVLLSGSIFNFKHYDPVLLPSLKKNLGNNYSFLQYDYVGIGHSSPLNGDFDFLTITRQHLELLDALGIDKSHHFGYSKGSLVSFLTAAMKSERVLSIAAYGSPSLGNNDEKLRRKYAGKREAMQSISGIWDEPINEFNYDVLYDTIFLSTVFPGKTLKTLSLKEKAKNKIVKKKLKPMLWDTRIEILDKLFKYYTQKISEEEMERYVVAMKGIDLPVLLMHGTNDRTVPITDSEMLNSFIKSSKFVKFDGFSHTAPVLDKKKGSAIMSEYAKFLKSIV